MSFEKEILFKDKYLSTSLRQIEAVVFINISFKYFSQHTQFGKLGNITGAFPSFSWGIFWKIFLEAIFRIEENFFQSFGTKFLSCFT